MYLLELVFLFSLDKYPEMKLLDLMIVLFLIFCFILILALSLEIYIDCIAIDESEF